MKYIINNRKYTLLTDSDDDLYEAALYPDDEGPADINLKGYGDTEEEAVRELKERLWEIGIKEGTPGIYRNREDRRKILVWLKGIKSELLGKWMTDEERYEETRKMAYDRYGYELGREEYKILDL